MAGQPIPPQGDSPDAQRYNRIRRWLGIADFAIGFVFLVVLLATRWSDSLRDLAYRMGFQNYLLSLFMYIVLLLGISKLLGRVSTTMDFFWNAASSSPIKVSAPGHGTR